MTSPVDPSVGLPSVGIPAEVLAICETWLAEVRRTAPGLVTGLHLRGGIGFGEFVPGTSDVDFVATVVRRPAGADLDALRAAHEAVARQHPDLPFDGAHLLAADLASDPEDCPDVPCVLHGHFEAEARYDLSPVAWHELAGHGVTVFGPPLAALGIWTSDAALREFTRTNLDTYWRDFADSLVKFPAEAATEETCVWCVLGVARLDHLLVTGEQSPKSGAARWGLTHYDARFHRVLREALRVREGGPQEYDDPAERGADVTAFTAHVVETGSK